MDHAVTLIFRYGQLALRLALMIIVAVALFRLLGYAVPGVRLTEASLQNLGIIIAAAAYYLK